MSESILVVGAGELGTEVVRYLSTHPSRPSSTSIAVLLRPSTIASPSPFASTSISLFHALGVTLLPGDIATMQDHELSSTFTPFTTVILCTGFASGRGTQLRLARAVLTAGVPRYFPWQFGVDYDVVGRGSAQDLFDEQLDVRDLLRGQTGTKWTIVSTGIFTSFLFGDGYGVVDLSKKNADGPVVRALGKWENETTTTTAEDIGRMTAEIAYARPQVDGVVHIAGDTVSYDRVAEIVEKVTGKKVYRELWDMPRLEEELREEPEDTLRKYRVVFGKAKGVAWPVVGTFNELKGVKLTTAEEWADRKSVV